ncbi:MULTISPECIES: hypothetical protein [unclassified Streptomyces]|uniref:hypothetical protein n=1 Tax=unclassified Streptomyces TaxID=2593676 RepID=UPI002DDC08BB|nr:MULTISPECIES: hypothetical protein [unclassified Streptomyces]WSC50885.1 hypothetical protein OIE61_42280 [Streptomyces sp. NBC_01762]WSC59191.1 hypothetical protein OG808_02330 [Streptomyces sp. NBC_01761]WSD30500.1 hypothetical protein OHA26_42655 [Streptomyces sp. NBC_01751]WSF90325.1 hypothetical protein OIE70_02400 [Streptomyces sp. NBC_01744]
MRFEHSKWAELRDPAPAEKTVPHPRRRVTLGVIAIVALVVAVHVGLAGLLLASGPWKHWVIGTVLGIILLKATYVLGRLAIRRNRTRETR